MVVGEQVSCENIYFTSLMNKSKVVFIGVNDIVPVSPLLTPAIQNRNLKCASIDEK